MKKFEYIINKYIEKRHLTLKFRAFETLILCQHTMAFKNQNSFLKMLSIIKKSYLIRLSRAFGTWKSDLDICKTEFFLQKKLLN